ncbi:MAG: NAD(P)H-dependent oxidoreductase subunit E, partial [Acetobacteraceae bacterium]
MAEDFGNGLPGDDADQPASFAFDRESETAIAIWIAKYPPGRQASAVLPLLDIVQRQMARTTGSA